MTPAPGGPAVCYRVSHVTGDTSQPSLLLRLEPGRDSGKVFEVTPLPVYGSWFRLGRDSVAIVVGHTILDRIALARGAAGVEGYSTWSSDEVTVGRPNPVHHDLLSAVRVACP